MGDKEQLYRTLADSMPWLSHATLTALADKLAEEGYQKNQGHVVYQMTGLLYRYGGRDEYARGWNAALDAVREMLIERKD
jgi:hypothetical protein